jgi:hypothetical protein
MRESRWDSVSVQKFLVKTRWGTDPLRPGGRTQPPRFRPATFDFDGDDGDASIHLKTFQVSVAAMHRHQLGAGRFKIHDSIPLYSTTKTAEAILGIWKNQFIIFLLATTACFLCFRA